MTLLDKHPAVREAFGCFEAFRRLGWPPEQIEIIVGADGIMIRAGAPDTRPFTIAAGKFPEDDHKAVVAQLREVVEHVGEIPEAELRANWRQSKALARAPAWLLKMAEIGVVAPLNRN